MDHGGERRNIHIIEPNKCFVMKEKYGNIHAKWAPKNKQHSTYPHNNV